MNRVMTKTRHRQTNAAFTVSREYDVLDCVTSSYVYDLCGNRISVTDPLGNTVYTEYDLRGRAVARRGATYPVEYGYDVFGQRVSMRTFRDENGAGDETRWIHDPATGLLLRKVYADGKGPSYTYTKDNLPLRKVFASGRWSENVYNARRTLSSVLYSDGEVESFVYGTSKNEIVASNGTTSVRSLWSNRGDCTNEEATVGNECRSFTRSFDTFGRLRETDGAFYTYAADGLLDSISNAAAVVEYAYTPGRLDAGYLLTLSNGVSFSCSLERDDRRPSLVKGVSNSVNDVAMETFAYAYDILGRPVSRNGDTFGYNFRGEVVSADISGTSRTYGYDGIGNSTSYTANNLNQYTEFSYDADGNLIFDGTRTFTYDAANRLKSISTNGTLVLENFYDAKSRRVRKVTPEATTIFFYDGWNLVEERVAYKDGVTVTIRNYWGKDLSGRLRGVGGIGGLLYLIVNGTVYVPSYDNNGNITRYMDANGSVVACYTYDAFGNIIAKSGRLADFFRHRFSTEYFDAETGLYYYGYRFYHPVLMRWLNRDTIEEDGGVNIYSFCRNNPIYQIDRLGAITCCRCTYSGNILHPGESTGFKVMGGEMCNSSVVGKIITISLPYACVPRFLRILGGCDSKTCNVSTTYQCNQFKRKKNPCSTYYAWVYLSDRMQPCSSK
ncbi:MAG: RHS repeat-associated core domain-containing protein [Kiritimatiellae bacterium]|nr:RHS repeat-associated core domain-containing protein [Kiritimatiellia bacterium]